MVLYVMCKRGGIKNIFIPFIVGHHEWGVLFLKVRRHVAYVEKMGNVGHIADGL